MDIQLITVIQKIENMFYFFVFLTESLHKPPPALSDPVSPLSPENPTLHHG